MEHTKLVSDLAINLKAKEKEIDKKLDTFEPITKQTFEREIKKQVLAIEWLVASILNI